jgi:hypothetical protein
MHPDRFYDGMAFFSDNEGNMITYNNVHILCIQGLVTMIKFTNELMLL